jgi:hypothetical protein
MSQQFEFLAQKTIGDDVSGNFASNAGPNTKNGRFLGVADFSDKFDIYTSIADAEANWLTAQTQLDIFIDVTNDVIHANMQRVSGNRAVSFDLWSQGIFPSDTKWTLRWKLTYTSIITGTGANQGNIGMFGQDATRTGSLSDSFILWKFFRGTNDTTLNLMGLESDFNDPVNDGAGDVLFDQKNVQGLTLYMELKRTSSTTYEGSIYSDADYTQLIEKLKTTCLSTIVDLRYIKVMNDDRLDVGGAFETEIDEMLFFNDTEGLQNFLTIKGNLQTPVFEDSFDSYGTPITPNYVDDFSDAAPWTTTDSTKLRIEDDQGFLFISAVANTTAYAIAHDLGDQITTTPTFEDDFSTDTWIDVGTNVGIVPPVLDFDNPPSSSFEDSATKDMLGGSISNFTWTLRFSYTPSTITQGTVVNGLAKQEVQFVISDLDSTNPVSTGQTFVGFRHKLASNNINEYQLFFAFIADMRGNILPQVATTVPTAGVTLFFQLKRLTSTSCELKIFSDSAYQNLLETLSSAMSASIVSLRYLKCNSWQGTAPFLQNDGQILGEIDDVKFWNNTVDIGGIISDTDNINKKFFFGIFDSDETEDATVIQDGMFVSFNTNLVPGDTIFIHAMNNNDPATAPILGTFTDTRLVPLLNQKYFLEMKRISTTDMQVGFYEDDTYSNKIEVITISTIPVNTINLRYIKVLNDPGSGAGNLDATVKNLEFWNATSNTRTTIADSYVQQGTDISIDKERSLVVYDAANQNSLEMLTTDVTGAVLGSIFNCRFKLVIDQKVQGADATPVMLLIGLSGFDGTQTLNQINSNWIGLRITISNTLNEFRAVGCRSNDFFDNPVTDTEINGGFTTLPDPGTYYFEITRTADIFSYIKIWADKDYTEIIEAIKINHGTLGSLLRYFKVGNGDNGDGTEDSTLIGTVDDIQLWENIRDPDGYGIREYYLQSSLVKFASGTMQVADIVSGDNASNPGGSEYKIRNSLNGGAETTGDIAEGTMAQGMVNSDVFIESFMNQDFKSVNSLALAANNVGANVPDKMVSIWRYQEFPQLEKLTLINSAGGLYGTDSRTTVWGSIP